MRSAVLLLVLAGLVRSGSAACANDCNGNGRCNAHSACECYRNWMGNDCSQRVCFFGRAFVDTPAGDLNSDGKVGARSNVMAMSGNTPSHELFDQAYAIGDVSPGAFDEAHFYAECSGKGSCERESGLCECFTGYEGEGCTRVSCATATGETCSGHGVCLRLVDTDSAEGSYQSWDSHKTQQCDCDPLYTGIACDQRACPSGDDPVTKFEHVTMLCGTWGLKSQVTSNGKDPSQLINDPAGPFSAGTDVYGTVSGASAKLARFCGITSSDVLPRQLSTSLQTTAENDCRDLSASACAASTACSMQAAVTRNTPTNGKETCITVQGVTGLFTPTDSITTGREEYLLNSTTRIQYDYRERLSQSNEVQTVTIRGARCAKEACVMVGGTCQATAARFGSSEFMKLADTTCGMINAANVQSLTGLVAETRTMASETSSTVIVLEVGTGAGITVGMTVTGTNVDTGTTVTAVTTDTVTLSTAGTGTFVTTTGDFTFGAPSKAATCAATKYDKGLACTGRNPFALTFKDEYGSRFTTRTIECISYDSDYPAASGTPLPQQLVARHAAADHCRGLVESALEDLPNSALIDIDVTDSKSGSFNDPSGVTNAIITWTTAVNVPTQFEQGSDHYLSVKFISNTGDVNLLTFLGQDTEAGAGTSIIHHANAYVAPDVLVEETMKGTSENAVCSNRGTCDYSTGICKCFQGFTRADCSLQNVLAMY